MSKPSATSTQEWFIYANGGNIGTFDFYGHIGGTGTVKGGRIEGVAIHRGKDPTTGKMEVTEFWFCGKLLS